MSVEVTVKGPHITVRSSDKPKGKVLHWSADMWESSVWQPIVEGNLPAMAHNKDAEPDPNGIRLSKESWAGGAVVWGGVEFDAGSWAGFEAAVKSGELSREALVQ